MLYKKAVLKNFAISTGKHLCWSLFLTKLLAYGPAILLKETPTQLFPVSIAKFLRIHILKNNFERLLLNVTPPNEKISVLDP